MFVNRRWRRRLQAAVGPGHDRRRAFRSPDHDHGRDSEVADTGRNRTRRDPATDRTARDAHSPRHVRRRALPHATSHRGCDPATDDSARDGPDRARSGEGRYGTRRSSRVRRCPVMPGYARNMFGRCPMMSRCRNRPAPALGVESGPTSRLSRAAERAVMKRHDTVKE